MPKAMSEEVGVGVTSFFTQFTNRTGAVFSGEVGDNTAKVAPVSSTLLVKTRRAPAKSEYFVNGRIIVLKSVKGLAPRIFEASSKSMPIRSIAEAIARTKYGYVMEICAKTSKAISGTKAKLLQKKAIEAPKATEGTINGTLTSMSKTVEGVLPALFRAISTAIGNPTNVLINVVKPATKYDRSRLPQ